VTSRVLRMWNCTSWSRRTNATVVTLSAAWLRLYELKLWPGLTIPPLLVTCVMPMMYRMDNASFFTAPIHSWSLSKDSCFPFSSEGSNNVSAFLGQEKNKLYFFLHALIVFMSGLAVAIIDWRPFPCNLFLVTLESLEADVQFTPFSETILSMFFVWLTVPNKPSSQPIWLKVHTHWNLTCNLTPAIHARKGIPLLLVFILFSFHMYFPKVGTYSALRDVHD